MATHKLNGKATASLPSNMRGELDFSNIRILGDKVLFVWVDELENTFTHASGIIIERKLDKDRPRWGQIVAMGPQADHTQLKVGDYVLPEKTNQPFGCNIAGIEVWDCKSDDIIMTSDDITSTHNINGD